MNKSAIVVGKKFHFTRFIAHYYKLAIRTNLQNVDFRLESSLKLFNNFLFFHGPVGDSLI